MAFDAHKNFAYSTVLTAPSPASSGTSVVVQSGDGAKFPTVSFNALIWPSNAQPTTANAEIVRVTAISTDTFTITRTQESTSARTVVVGDQIAAIASAKTFTDIENFLPNNLTGSFNFNAPQGFLINGKLSVTVASNNLTVAIKGADGNDPSATNPVYCRIQDTIRSITAALSVTKNAGTNWFGSGATKLATSEIDYFAYLGYNATDGVVIGFARISTGTKYGDFSATTTSERYCAISTITTAASTDYYELIGRFAATLSATASFNWSVPTFTAINLIQRPIYETRWLNYTPVYTGYSASPSGGAWRYKLAKDICYLQHTVSSQGTSNSASFGVDLPIVVGASGQGYFPVPVYDNTALVSAAPGSAYLAANATTITIGKTLNSGGFTTSGGKDAQLNIWYEID